MQLPADSVLGQPETLAICWHIALKFNFKNHFVGEAQIYIYICLLTYCVCVFACA